jgi:uncharacterized protein YcbK (DUF882 family)
VTGTDHGRPSRRRILALGVTGISSLVAPSRRAGAADARTLALLSLHTGESVRATYWASGQYIAEGLARIDRLLRDHRNGAVHAIDRRLLDALAQLRQRLDTREAFEIISGYRSPATNARLAATTSGVSSRSLHMAGMAIDIRVPGRSLAAVRDAARALGVGGVGYYPDSNFVHVDVGRVRYW